MPVSKRFKVSLGNGRREAKGAMGSVWRAIGLWAATFCAVTWSWMLPCFAGESTLELIKPMSYSNAELRGKDFSHQDLRASDFANANMEGANFSQADLRGAIFSASVMQNADLRSTNLQYAMMDQVDFTEANLENAILTEALLFRSTFSAANITGADFSDALLDGEQRAILCESASGTNMQTGVSTRASLDCKS
ncbi:pentapeptide repeat-containing protein [Altericista sp. CCNU0014]|uniref:pentapeptide repeat-containing protein n=1 Tax=Altericista sp. CCNU0014 TaxID=3082949 RepID=UPI00384A49DB